MIADGGEFGGRDLDSLVDAELTRFASTVCELGCDSVQIVLTRHDALRTRSRYYGRGNVYARIGSVREWLAYTEASGE